MSSLRFLVDEHVPVSLLGALRQGAKGIDLLCVGDPGAPPRQSPDPDLLAACEILGRVLLTMDRKSMPQHLRDHFDAGRHTAGVLLMRRGLTLAEYRDEILLIYGATTADEWIDQTWYIP